LSHFLSQLSQFTVLIPAQNRPLSHHLSQLFLALAIDFTQLIGYVIKRIRAMATIRKRGNYQWQAIIRKANFPAQSKTFETKVEALKWAGAVEESMTNESFKGILKATVTPFSEIIDKYLVDVTPHKKGAEKEYSRIRVIKRTLTTLSLLNKPIGSISADDLTDYIDYREDVVGAKTINLELAIISHIFTKARKKYRIKVDNPVSDIEKPKIGKPRNRRCSKIEQKVLLKVARKYGKDEMMEIIIPLAIETAMRRGEIAALQWEYIDLDDGTAFLPDTKNGEPRTVPLSPYAIQLLRQAGVKESGRPFPIRADSITKAFSRIRDKVGITDLRFHDMRHEATSRLFEKGLSATEVKMITGHKSYQMLDRYTHLNARHIVEKLAVVDELERLKQDVKRQRNNLRLVA